MATEKVAVTVQAELLEEVERLRRRTGESRSAVFNRAIRELVAATRHAAQVRRYVEAYAEMPETDAEVEAADALARESLKHAPSWDER